MPTVTLSDTSFAEAKLIAEPLVDSLESLIARLIHEEVLRRGTSPSGNGHPVSKAEVIRLDPVSHENLAHTRVLSAMIDGEQLYRPKWNGIMDRVHVLAMKRLGSFDALKRASRAHLRQGRFEDEGFKYLPDADVSIQGMDANLAWDNALRVARTIDVSIRVTFEWRDKEGAVYPGLCGVLEWSPSNS